MNIQGVPFNSTENDTYPIPMMSSPDDDQTGENDEEPGWWKHTGNSHVSHQVVSMGTLASTGDPAIDIKIFLNGQSAGDYPGPVLITGSELIITYEIINSGDLGISNVSVEDDRLGDVGECDILYAGESISFKLKDTVQEGKFSSAGRVSGFREGSLDICSAQSPFYYSGKTEYEEIPEFPTFIVPLTTVLCLAFMFERRRM